MNKLKTLKDLQFDRDGRGGSIESYQGDYVCPDNLRRKAIKWIKWFEQNINPKEEYKRMKSSPEAYYTVKNKDSLFKSDMKDVHNMIDSRRAMMKWIKHFFNIAEEDLK